MIRKIVRDAAAGFLRFRGAARFSDSSFGSKLEMFHKRVDAEEACRGFAVSEDTLADVSTRMSEAYARAAAGGRHVTPPGGWPPAPGHPATTLPRVRRFLGLDLAGATRFGARLASLSDTRDVLVGAREYPLAARLRTGSGRELFDHVARGLAKFADQHGVRKAGLPLAFAFGFPVRHVALRAAVLDRWTKEFDCVDLVCRDVVAELRGALDRAGVAVGPIALLNDATVAMVNSVAESPDTRVGLVVGDGCGCCYAERADRVVMPRSRFAAARRAGFVPATSHMVVNTEWGAFGEDGALDHVLTEYDWRLDERSRHPGKRIFEKMTSGMYMGELARDLVLAMAGRGVLFDGKVTPAMQTEYRLTGAHLSHAESDGSNAAARAVLTDVLRVADPTDADCALFRYACECVTRRSAHLVAAGLAGVLRRVHDDSRGPTTVAVGGSVLETHRKYVFAVGGMASRLLHRDPITEFVLRTADHGVGAPLMADLLARAHSAPTTALVTMT